MVFLITTYYIWVPTLYILGPYTIYFGSLHIIFWVPIQYILGPYTFLFWVPTQIYTGSLVPGYIYRPQRTFHFLDQFSPFLSIVTGNMKGTDVYYSRFSVYYPRLNM